MWRVDHSTEQSSCMVQQAHYFFHGAGSYSTFLFISSHFVPPRIDDARAAVLILPWVIPHVKVRARQQRAFRFQKKAVQNIKFSNTFSCERFKRYSCKCNAMVVTIVKSPLHGKLCYAFII